MRKFTIYTPHLSTNRIYAGKKVLTPLARNVRAAIQQEATTEYEGKLLTKDVEVRVDFFWPDRRRRDVDNLKLLLDSLSGIVWEDDNQIIHLCIKKHLDPANPRIEITIL